MPELRKDPVVGRWIILSAERGKRPNDFALMEGKKAGGSCPFCPGHEEETPPEITAARSRDYGPDRPGWSIRVIPNKFPALQVEGNVTGRTNGRYERMNGVGVHEVIIETPDHRDRLGDLSSDRISGIFRIFRERIVDLKKDRKIRHILIFKNHGQAAGATIEHPHWQLIATPMVPKRVLEELEGSRMYHALEGRCVYCDMIDGELRDRERLVCSNDGFVSIEAYASRFPFETWIIPRRHGCRYEEIEGESIPELAVIFKETLIRIDRALNSPDYNLIIHSSPFGEEDHSFYHWHMEIIPRTTVVSGFEWGSGFYINTTAPEAAAAYLREVDI